MFKFIGIESLSSGTPKSCPWEPLSILFLMSHSCSKPDRLISKRCRSLITILIIWIWCSRGQSYLKQASFGTIKDRTSATLFYIYLVRFVVHWWLALIVFKKKNQKNTRFRIPYSIDSQCKVSGADCGGAGVLSNKYSSLVLNRYKLNHIFHHLNPPPPHNPISSHTCVHLVLYVDLLYSILMVWPWRYLS